MTPRSQRPRKGSTFVAPKDGPLPEGTKVKYVDVGDQGGAILSYEETGTVLEDGELKTVPLARYISVSRQDFGSYTKP